MDEHDIMGLCKTDKERTIKEKYFHILYSFVTVRTLALIYLGLMSFSTHCIGYIIIGSFRAEETSIY